MDGKVVNIGHKSVSAEAIRKALESSKDADGNVHLDDLVETSMLMMFFVQRLGKASIDDIVDKAKEIGAIVDRHLADQGLEALRARGLVSYARGRRKGGDSVKMWKPKRVVWAAPPEVAHIVDLLPALVATDEAQELVALLNQTEEDGDGDSKKTRRLDIDEYTTVRIDFLSLDQILGSQPESPALDALYKKSPFKVDAADLRFFRADGDGAIMIASDVIRGWLGVNLRQKPSKGFAGSKAAYVGCSPALIYPKQMIQIALPIIDKQTREGLGIASYECLPPGQRFPIFFRIPERGFFTAIEFVKFVAAFGPNPIRGLSPARGARFGRVAVVGHEVIKTQTIDTMLEATALQLPDEAKSYAATLLKIA